MADGQNSALAIFDLDGTLLDGDSELMWSHFLVKEKLVGRDFMARMVAYSLEYQLGKLDILEYEAFLLKPLTEHPLEELLNLRDRYLNLVQRVVRPFMLRIVHQTQGEGYTLLIISASNNFLVEPIAEMLGFSEIICTQIEIHEGYFTTRIKEPAPFKDGKINLLESWLAKHHQTMDGSWGYSDSHNDLPLLQKVEHPVAVRPDPILRQHARECGWKVVYR
jgi:HAD superfamily hydrolase (TIGR01490 family)